jgi:hypothetical protein
VALLGRVTVAEGRLTVFNDADLEWTNVIATPNDTLVCNVGIVHPHDQAGMNLANCSGGPLAAPVVSVRVVAQQGFFVAAVPAANPEVPPAPAAPPEPAAPRAAASASATPSLRAHASMSGGLGPARRVTVFNDSGTGWTGCTVYANDLYSYAMKNVAAGDHEGIMMIRFKDSAGNPFTSNAQINRVKIRCDQGSTSVQPQ